MAMKMLKAGGLELVMDESRPADEDNPKGYFELEKVKSLGEQRDTSWLAAARGKAIKVISHLLEDLPPGYRYQVLFMHRPIQEVIRSQNKMLERRGEPLSEDDARIEALFDEHLRSIRRWLQGQANFRVLDLHYREVIDDPHGNARRIADFVGRSVDLDLMASVVDSNLYRNRESELSPEQGIVEGVPGAKSPPS